MVTFDDQDIYIAIYRTLNDMEYENDVCDGAIEGCCVYIASHLGIRTKDVHKIIPEMYKIAKNEFNCIKRPKKELGIFPWWFWSKKDIETRIKFMHRLREIYKDKIKLVH